MNELKNTDAPPWLIRVMEHLTSDFYYRAWNIVAAVVLGLWLWEGPSFRRFIAAAAVISMLYLLSFVTRRYDRRVLFRLKSSALPHLSSAQKVLVWAVFVIIVVVFGWLGFTSA